MPAGERIYLAADLHLKPLDASNAKARDMAVADNVRLARFLEHIQGKASSLILLGDTFNFWFERRGKVVGDYYTALSLFKLAADQGLDIHHVSGNRDYAVGEGLGFDPTTRYPGFLRYRRGFTVSRLCDFGIEPHGPRYRFHHTGKTVVCQHGDALCTNDRLFMALRGLLQGWPGRYLMRWTPLAVMEMIVGMQQGRTRARKPGRDPGAILGEDALKREMAMGADLLLCGHLHAGLERDVAVAGRKGKLVVLPPWLEGWYGVLEDGTVTVDRFE